jgi:hypothetical protein
MQSDFINKSLCQLREASITRAKEETFAANDGRRGITENWSQFVIKSCKRYNYYRNYNEYSRGKEMEVIQCQIYEILCH